MKIKELRTRCAEKHEEEKADDPDDRHIIQQKDRKEMGAFPHSFATITLTGPC